MSFEQHLKTQIIHLIERYINKYFQNDLEQQVNPSIVPSSTRELKTREFQPLEASLKTTKELGKILGVSVPYIKTLNRIGELKQ